MILLHDSIILALQSSNGKSFLLPPAAHVVDAQPNSTAYRDPSACSKILGSRPPLPSEPSFTKDIQQRPSIVPSRQARKQPFRPLCTQLHHHHHHRPDAMLHKEKLYSPPSFLQFFPSRFDYPQGIPTFSTDPSARPSGLSEISHPSQIACGRCGDRWGLEIGGLLFLAGRVGSNCLFPFPSFDGIIVSNRDVRE